MNDSQKMKRKKQRQSYYKKCQFKRQKKGNAHLVVGMKGFLVTCNREKAAVQEIYNILNEYADKIYGPEQIMHTTEEQNVETDDEDIGENLQKEVSAIKSEAPSERRFQLIDIGAKNHLFFRTSIDYPCDLVHAIMKDLLTTKVQKSRYALRLFPILGTCRAFISDIKTLSEKILETFFQTPLGTKKTFGIHFKASNNDSIKKEIIIHELCQMVYKMNPLNKVSYNNPDYIILIEIICNFCFISVIKDFYALRKYNLQEVVRCCQASVSENKETDAVEAVGHRSEN